MQLNEGLSSIVYHFTYIHNLINILEENKFILSTNLGSDADLNTSKGKFYFFSTTRSKTKQYRNSNVKIKLDGNKLQSKYKAFPIDYWNYSKNPKDWGDKGSYRQALLSGEEEDRIVSNKPYIDNAKSYILEISVLIDKHDIENLKKKYINQLINLSKDIKIFYYTDKKSYLLEDKRNIVNINNINFTKEDNEEGYKYTERFSLWRLASLLSYNDDEMKNKVVEVLSKKNPKEDVLKEIEETTKKDNYNYYYEFIYNNNLTRTKKEFIDVIKADIHNARSSKNDLNIEIIQLVVQYMNKYKLKNITDFIFKKLKGNFKYQDEFRDDLVNDFNIEIDNILKRYIEQYNEYRYRVGDYTYHNIFYEFPELRSFLYREVYKIKEYIKSIVLNKDIEFKYLSGQIQKSNIMNYLNLDSFDFNQILTTDKYKELEENFDLSEDLVDDLKRIIENVVSDVDYNAYDLKNKYIKKYEDQYKPVQESINEAINTESSYPYNIFKKNNKIGFYTFKNNEGIEYEVRMSKYVDEINSIDSNILDIEFAADNEWKQSSKVKDPLKVFSTIGSILKDYYTNNIDYITYILDRNDNPEKRNKIYQHIVKNIGLKISDVIKKGSNVYLKINKPINENYTKKISPSELSNKEIVDNIIDYLYNNNEYNIVNGVIKKYNKIDGIKSILIEIIGNEKGPYKGNYFYIYPHISFNLISNKNGYNIEIVDITSELNGFYKDLDVDKGKHLKFIRGFDNEFYRLLKRELISNFRFNKPIKLKKDFSPIKISNINKDDEVINLEPSYVNYIESLALKDSNLNRRNRILKLVEKVRKQNHYTKRSLYDFFERYKRGDIK